MLQTKIRAALEKRARGDKGFTLIELLVVVIIIGILAAVAIPVFLGQRQKAFDAGVQSDLKNLATSAETTFVENLRYPAEELTFASNGVAPIITAGNTFVVFIHRPAGGAGAGYIIYGTAEGSPTVWVLSSYNGGAPARTTRTELNIEAGAQPNGPVPLNAPSGITYAALNIP